MAGYIKTIKVGNKDIRFESNGATFVLYQQAFRKDGLSAFQDIEEDPMKVLGIVQEFAYIMSGAYEAGVNYIKWLSQFELLDIPNAAEEILEVLNGNIQGADGGMVKNAASEIDL